MWGLTYCTGWGLRWDFPDLPEDVDSLDIHEDSSEGFLFYSFFIY